MELELNPRFSPDRWCGCNIQHSRRSSSAGVESFEVGSWNSLFDIAKLFTSKQVCAHSSYPTSVEEINLDVLCNSLYLTQKTTFVGLIQLLS